MTVEKILTTAFALFAALATAAAFAAGTTTLQGVLSVGAAGIFAGVALIAGRFWWLDRRDEQRHQAQMKHLTR